MKAKKSHLALYNYYCQTAIILILGLLLLINIAASQMLSPLYFGLVNDNHQATVNYLKQIRFSPVFTAELNKSRQIYGVAIEKFVFANDRDHEQLIEKYTATLQKNPQSVTALYNLSILYRQDGNNIKADEYFRKAVELDPIILNPKIPNSKF